MKTRKIQGFHLVMAAALSLYCGSSFAAASTVVHVQEAQGPSNYTIKMGETSIPAGKVTFTVKNHSKSLEHEFVVAKTNLAANELPYDKSTKRVEEHKLDVVGEVDDVQPGMSGSNTLDLKPGKYVGFCNEPGHYQLGMYVAFKVVK